MLATTLAFGINLLLSELLSVIRLFVSIFFSHDYSFFCYFVYFILAQQSSVKLLRRAFFLGSHQIWITDFGRIHWQNEGVRKRKQTPFRFHSFMSLFWQKISFGWCVSFSICHAWSTSTRLSDWKVSPNHQLYRNFYAELNVRKKRHIVKGSFYVFSANTIFVILIFTVYGRWKQSFADS